MSTVFEAESYVSPEAAWHQELTFDEPYPLTVVIEVLDGGPVYGFYLDEDDFQAMTENGEVDDAIRSRVQNQLLCEDERGVAKVEVEFPPGRLFICVELDVESAPDAKRTEFRLSLHEDE